MPEQVIRRELHPQETHKYQFSLEAGQYGQLQIQSPGNQITGSVADPKGNSLSEFISSESDLTRISVIAKTKGEYSLALHSLVPAGAQIIYSLKFDGIRPTTGSDNDRLAAEANATTAEKLKREWKEEELRRAIEKYREAQTIWHSINESGEVAKALRKVGELYLLLGEKDLAHSSFQRALEQYQAQSNFEGQAKIHIDLSELSRRFEDFSEARIEAEKARSLGEKIGDEAIVNEALVTLEELARNDNYQVRLARLQTLLQYWIKNRNIYQQAKTSFKIGHIYYFEGDHKNALLVYSQTLQMARILEDRYREAHCLVRIGHIYSVIGEKQQARSSYDKAEIILEQIGDAFGKATLASGLGFVFEELGDPQRALFYRQKGFDICTELKLGKSAAVTLLQVAKLKLILGDAQTALDKLKQAYQSFQALGDQRLLVQTLREMGLVYEGQKNIPLALSYYQKALALNQMGKPGDERWKAYLLSDIGRIRHLKGQFEQALRSYQQALALNLKIEDSIGQSQTRFFLAKLERDRGNLREAIAQIEKSVSFIESLRAKVISQDLRTSYFASVNQICELYRDLLMQQHREQAQGGFAAEALSVSERARARSLLDLLNESRHNIQQGADPKWLEQERLLRQTLNGKADRKLQLANQMGREAELAALTKEVNDLTTQLDDIRSKIRETSPRYAALTQPQPLKAEEMQRLLDDDTLLLEFALGEEHSYLWAVTRTTIDAYLLPNRATIEPLVREVYQLMTAPPRQGDESAAAWYSRVTQARQQYWPRAAALSQMVLGPVAEKLNHQRLVIVSDGALQLLPFAALPNPVVGGGWPVAGDKANANRPLPPSPLLVQHEITYLPSASSLKLLRENRGQPLPPSGWLARWQRSIQAWLGRETQAPSLRSVAVLADPVFEKDDKRVRSQETAAAQLDPSHQRAVDLSDENLFLPRLIATREEAAEIEKAAGNHPFLLKHSFEVNRALLTSEALNPYGVVHFATHGLWDSNHPELSCIFLSRVDQQGNKIDGTLRLSDVYNLILPKELVVLSACETAVGKDVRGEGLIALTRGFMYAGAARVMASLWKVEDGATAEMMRVFYQRLLQDQMTPAAALRQAQLAMWQKDPTNAPYRWAAFVLQGEYR